MANGNLTLDSVRGLCPEPFFQEGIYPPVSGYVNGRVCAEIPLPTGDVINCCLGCPMTDWVYPDNFNKISQVANWINVAGMAACAFLLLSWIALPVEKTHRHYLSISLTCGVVFMNLGFIIPLAAAPDQCADTITPNGMRSSTLCGVSGAFLIGGGWAGIMWIFLRALSLHLQICWQIVIGRTYMWFAQLVGWGIPIIGLAIALSLSGVSFRFGATCHINHAHSLADFWIPLLAFAGLTVIIQFATFGYCIKVYIASLTDQSTSTEGSNMPSYTNSIRTMTPKQAYRRIRRVIELQWRGIIIVLVIIADVVFFSIVFVFQDNAVENIKENPEVALPWVKCMINAQGDKSKCFSESHNLAVPLPTVMAVLILLAINGLWLLLLLGRWSMVTAWGEMIGNGFGRRSKKEFVSVDAARNDGKEPRSYEMLSRDRESGKTESVLTAVSPVYSPGNESSRSGGGTAAAADGSGRRTPDYFNPSRYQSPDPYAGSNRYQNSDADGSRYHTPEPYTPPSRIHNPHHRSFSSPRPPQQVSWNAASTFAQPEVYENNTNPLGMNRI